MKINLSWQSLRTGRVVKLTSHDHQQSDAFAKRLIYPTQRYNTWYRISLVKVSYKTRILRYTMLVNVNVHITRVACKPV